MRTERQIESAAGHRPWPLPARPWVMFQSWRELLFAHWPVPPGTLRPLVPPQLELETFRGDAWVGLTPFLVTDLHPRGLPPPPALSTFPEMNLRTYVRVGDRPGIFFFTLEAASRLAVAGARAVYRLPYRAARMHISHPGGGWIRYQSRRRGGRAEFACRYRPTGPTFHAAPGTLEHFLVERYALYSVLRSGRILRGDIHHRPWPLQAADVELERNTVAEAHGIELPAREPLCHFAARQDTLVWPPAIARG